MNEEVQRFINDLKFLDLEFGGIDVTIKRYTSQANILNYLAELKKNIKNKDVVSIKYCLNQIEKWYASNISKIQTDAFVTDNDAHIENYSKIKKYCQTFNNYSDEIEVNVNDEKKESDKPLIFLSHCSKNQQYGDALEKFLIGLGIENEQLIYTSHPLHKIPLDKNIYDYLRENIYGNVFMIILWSNDYLESPACLNEMGALWVTQADYTNIYVPDFEFGNPKYHECAVDTRKMGAVLKGDAHCKTSMIELKDKIIKMFGLTIDEKTFSYILDDFIKNITEEK